MTRLTTIVNNALKSGWLTYVLIIACLFSIVVRFVSGLQQFVSYDATNFLLPWVKALHDGGWATYGTEFSNYAPLYTYFLGIVAMLPSHMWLFGIKLVSILADIVLAVAAGCIVGYVKRDKDSKLRRNLSLLASTLALCIPTVIINSSQWGQCDSIWTALLLLSLLWFLKDKPLGGMLWFGLAFAVKMQAIFFAPVIFMLLLCGKAKWWQLLVVPAMYLLTCIPCAIAGRDWSSLLSVYLNQGTTYEVWGISPPSPYLLLDIFQVPYAPTVVLIILVIVALLTVPLCATVARRCSITPPINILIFTALCGLMYPYVLPGMHDRYMYFGDIATMVAAVAVTYDIRLWAAAVFSAFGSLMVMNSMINFSHPKIGMLSTTASLVLIAISFIVYLRKGVNADAENNSTV